MLPESNLIYSYSRAQALADGVLVDVTEQARQTGFVCPVAITHAVHVMLESMPEAVQGIQSYAGRLHDCLWMAFIGIKRAPGGGSELPYQFYLSTERAAPQLITLKLVCGPGDEGEMVITIMELGES